MSCPHRGPFRHGAEMTMIGLYFVAMGATVIKFAGFPEGGTAIMLFGGAILYVSCCFELRNLQLRRIEMGLEDDRPMNV